jgi:hypothetical protein
MTIVIGGILQNLFFQFISDIIIDSVNGFETFLNDLFSGSVDMLSRVTAIEKTCKTTTVIGSALVVLFVLYKLFDVYIFENSGDSDADPLDLIVKGSFAMAVIQSNETIFEVLRDLSKEFADDLSEGAHLTDDFQTGIKALLRRGADVSGTANIIIAVILVVAVIAVLIKMSIRGAELMLMKILFPIFASDIVSTNSEKWSSFFASYLVLFFGYSIQLFCFDMFVSSFATLTFSENLDFHEGTVTWMLLGGWLLMSIKAPKWLDRYTYSSGVGHTMGSTAKSLGRIVTSKIIK